MNFKKKETRLRTVALETSSLYGSIAALEAGQLIKEVVFPSSQKTAQSLAPALKELCADVGWQTKELELVCVTQGPGSFTGLRVGITTAKILAYASGSQIVGVNTLEAIASQQAVSGGRIRPLIDAQRKQLFTASYRFPLSTNQLAPASESSETSERVDLRDLHSGEFCRLGETALTSIVDRSEFLDSLEKGDVLCGPGLTKIMDQLEALNQEVVVAVAANDPMASTIGKIGYQKILAGQPDDPFGLSPKYYRLSAAEEKAAEDLRQS